MEHTSLVAPCQQGIVALLVLVLCGLAGPTASGQTLWSRPYESNQITVEAIVPSLLEDGTSVLSGGAFLSGTYLLTDHVELAAELPAARVDGDAGPSKALGNPYVGIGLTSTSTPVLVEIGARLPVASSDLALRSGSNADIGRTRAFHPNEISVSTLLNGRFMLGRVSSLRLRAGAAYASFSPIDTTSQRTEQDWRLQYSLQYWREGESLLLGLSFTGQALLTGPGDYAADSRHFLLGTVMGDGRTVRPGLLVGLSAEDLDDPALLVGLTVSVPYAR